MGDFLRYSAVGPLLAISMASAPTQDLDEQISGSLPTDPSAKSQTLENTEVVRDHVEDYKRKSMNIFWMVKICETAENLLLWYICIDFSFVANHTQIFTNILGIVQTWNMKKLVCQLADGCFWRDKQRLSNSNCIALDFFVQHKIR